MKRMEQHLLMCKKDLKPFFLAIKLINHLIGVLKKGDTT